MASVIFANLPSSKHRHVTLNDILSSCPRLVYLRYTLNKPQLTLVDAIREAGKEPILRALERAGWQVKVPYIDTIAGLEIRDVVDALKGRRVAVVTVGRPDSLLLSKLSAFIALLNVEVGYLIFANPRSGDIGVKRQQLSHVQKRETLELLKRRAELLATYLHAHRLPPRVPTPLCPHCPLGDICKALKVMENVSRAP